MSLLLLTGIVLILMGEGGSRLLESGWSKHIKDDKVFRGGDAHTYQGRSSI